MIENIDILKEVHLELKRFVKKLELAIKEQSNPNASYANRDYAACKRAAMDLKRELTKLTQDSKYKWHGGTNR